MLWRHGGRQRSLTFENLPAAERFKSLLEDHGPDEALRIIELGEASRSTSVADLRLRDDRLVAPLNGLDLNDRRPRRLDFR